MKAQGVPLVIKESRNSLPLIIGIYALVVFWTIWHHEPWRDEAQVWLLCRELSLGSLFHELPYNGHPFLWYLLVFPLPKLGLPYLSMGILHGVIIVTAAWVFLKRAPFPLYFKIMFLFSYFMIYEYAAIARNYSISVLLLFLLAGLYRSKHERPILFGFLIALLCNTNTHSIFAAGAMGLLFLISVYKHKADITSMNKQWFGLAIMIAGAGFAFFSLRVQADGWQPWLENPVSWGESLEAIGNAFVPLCLTNPGMTLLFKPWWVNVMFVLFLIVTLYSIRKSAEAVIFFSLATLGLLYILTFRYSGYLRHYGLIFMFLIVAIWIFWEENIGNGKTLTMKFDYPLFSFFVFRLLSIFLILSLVIGAKYVVKDLRYPFSGAKEMAEYIQKKNIKTEIISAYNIYTITAIFPYLPGVSWWDPGLERRCNFIHWDKDYSKSRMLMEEEFMQRSLTQTEGKHSYYILLCKPLLDPRKYGLILEYAANNANITGDEKYYLYRNL